MNSLTKETLTIVGISTRTSNAPGNAENDIPKLWHEFMENQSIKSIPNKTNDTMYALYTDYESDHTGAYTVLLGYEVDSLDQIPEAYTVKIVPKTKYQKFTAKGDLTKDAVINAWKEIWSKDLKRTYTTDIEVYGEKAMNPKNGEADIYIAVE
ncbi:GyrI-like domain-containing protein [Flavicella marina]|uniref:GyrI-like domain-containing protein n=1 Tax=Flavicella marina TaxID=1475951 RepID=UPI00126502E8|nr:GyrI-like domain-containing protein [Flavicella marina]